MHWYGGSIAEAVTLSKQKNAIFVVFVEGDNELSSEMTSVLDDAAVLQRLADSANFLAIRLKSGSTDYTHFAQIYQFVPVPSLFFIGRNGTPLEVVCAGVQASNLASRIDRILEEHHKNKPAQPSTSSKDIKEQTVNLLASESSPPAPAPGGSKVPAAPTPVVATAAVAQREPEPSEPAAKVPKLDDQEVVCNDGVCVRRPRADGAGPSRSPDRTPQEPEAGNVEATESTISTEEKMERAKALIEAKRKEKAEKEQLLEKEKEKERRNTGQGVAELKRWQADQELKQIQEERKREKLENNLQRQRILEQIAQDRAERRARDNPPEPRADPRPATDDNRQRLQDQLKLARAERHALAQPTPAVAEPEVVKPVEQAAPATSGDAGAHARIQFKLPDGSSHTANFAADSCLGDVQRYVAENLNLPASHWSLWSAFPRRELAAAAAGESLRALRLAPAAALLVLPRAQPPARPGHVGNVIAFVSQLLSTIIVEPSHRLYAWLLSWVSPRGAPAPGPAPRPAPDPARGAAPDPAPRAAPNPALRRRGNVHRLQGDRPDDDNNTWNGNSTQQM